MPSSACNNKSSARRRFQTSVCPAPATPQRHPLSLHDALPIWLRTHSGGSGYPPRDRRSAGRAHRAAIQRASRVREGQLPLSAGCPGAPRCQLPRRSEEHTSELQSHHDLVCRLLLATTKAPHAADSRRLSALPPRPPSATLFPYTTLFRSGFERIREVLDTHREIVDLPGARTAPPFKGQVEFEKVNFHYQPDVPVLRDVSFRVEPGQVAALAGPTGAGKTTIISLIPRFYDPVSGVVKIDGSDVRRYTQESLRQQI